MFFYPEITDRHHQFDIYTLTYGARLPAAAPIFSEQHGCWEYSQTPLNPYLSVEGIGYGL